MVLDEGAEIAGPYKVHVSGTISELTGEKFYVLFREFLFIVILMYPMPSLTLMLDILGNFLVGVFQALNTKTTTIKGTISTLPHRLSSDDHGGGSEG